MRQRNTQWYKRNWTSWPFIVFMLGAGVTALLSAKWPEVIAMATAIVIAFLPPVLERWWGVRVPWWAQLGLVLFLTFSLLMGFVGGYYHMFVWWDDFVHAFSGVVIGVYGIIFVQRIAEVWAPDLPMSLRIVFVVMFGITIAALWEVGEFSGDRLLAMHSQNDDLTDNMLDIVYGTLGTLVAALVYYFARYIRVGRNDT